MENTGDSVVSGATLVTGYLLHQIEIARVRDQARAERGEGERAPRAPTTRR